MKIAVAARPFWSKCQFLLLLIAGLAGTCRSAWGSTSYVSRVWLREDGLPQNEVAVVAQTHDGYLWIGTYNGLARFDGVRFVCYDSGNTPALGDSQVTSLFEAPDGTLWIGHETGEVTRYAQGRFEPAGENVPSAKKRIMDIGADEVGDVWLLSEDGLLARVRDGLAITLESGMENSKIEMTRSPRGSIWVNRAGRVSVLRHAKLIPLEFQAGMTNHAVSAIGASRNGGLWMMVDGRLRKWNDGAWSEDRGPAPLGSSPLLKLIESRNGVLLGASDRGFAMVFPDGKVEKFNRSNGFFSDWVTDLCEDREGDYWAGTGNGLAMIRESCAQTTAPPDGWQGRSVKSVCFDHENTMWVSTEGAGIYRCQNGVWTNYGPAAGSGSPYVWSLAEDTEGKLWAGTWGAGLRLWQGDHFILAPGMAGITMPIPSLLAARHGGLWVGTTEGLLRYGADEKESWLTSNSRPSRQDVRCILETGSGDVWFGVSNEGLFHWAAGKLKQYRKADGLPGDFVRCLHEDETGALWIGASDGLCRFKDNHFATISVRQGLHDNVICDIEDDGHGFFWMSSYNGIFRVSKSELRQCADGQLASVHSLAFGIADGLPTLEATSGGNRSADGKLWFPTERGLVAIDPLGVKTNLLPPPVLIEGLFVDDQPMDRAASTGNLKIPPGRHRFGFPYTGLSFVAPEKVRFKYRLEKLDADWIDAGTKRVVDYPYIPPGDYVFHVIACNNDGLWNETGASLAFTVLPFFWQTGWFHFLVGLAAVLGASGIVWFEMRRRLRHRLEFLERQRAIERERTRIAKDIHDDLGASLTRINLLSQSARRAMDDPPQMGQSLDQICITARQLTRAMDEIVWAVDPQHDTLDSLAGYFSKVAQEVLGISGIRCRLDFPEQLPASPVTADIRHNIFLAFKEALHNVLKHSAATEVQIALLLESAAVAVSITDNGRGFDSSMLAATASKDSQPARGGLRLNGLINMRRRLQEIGGRCEIRSEPESGTRVTFYFPMVETANGSKRQDPV